MNQQELVDAVAQATGTSKAEAAKALGAVINTIRDSLKRGEKVAIAGFGAFELAKRGPRKGRNFHIGEAIDVPPMTQVKFKPGKGLRDAVND